ncbi:MAG: nucleotidyltransferase domain-containing protein [Sphingobacteriaceae bacterium]|nr:nucleotidyltransferase domain-containing protein [Sphingobacteriaceae bacterium]
MNENLDSTSENLNPAYRDIEKILCTQAFEDFTGQEKVLENIHKLCLLYNVEKMYAFGSVLNSNFNNKSDIDLLVKFKNIELEMYFENYINLKENLEKLFKRDVDLLEEQTLKNPILIQSINKSKELIYG